MKRLTMIAILVLALVRLALLTASAQTGASEYTLMQTVNGQVVLMPATLSPICYSFAPGGQSTRALTRYDGLAWHIQIDVRYSFVVTCDGYEWSRVDARFNVIALTPSRIDSQMVYQDTERRPHTVAVTVCRYAPRLGVSFCYDAIVSLESDSDGARFWVNTSSSWYVTTLTIDNVRYYEYNLLTHLPDGRVITDPTDDSEFIPWCVSFDGDYRGSHASTPIRPRFDHETMTWRIDVDARYHYALYCDDRAITVIEDADRGMPGAVLILDTMPMGTYQLHKVIGHEPVVVSAVICTSPDSFWTRWEGHYCYQADVWTESAPDHSVTEWYTNVTDGWYAVVTIVGHHSTSDVVGSQSTSDVRP